MSVAAAVLLTAEEARRAALMGNGEGGRESTLRKDRRARGEARGGGDGRGSDGALESG